MLIAMEMLDHWCLHFLDAGVNCMFPHEVNSSGHPAELLNKYGKELRIMGGLISWK